MITTVSSDSCDSVQATVDWAVPQSSRLKYRQLFNSHDKMMSGHLTGTQAHHFFFLSYHNSSIILKLEMHFSSPPSPCFEKLVS